jgi:hypothetical protein
VVIVIWIMDHPAMYHGGYMAALNLTWFRAGSRLKPEIYNKDREVNDGEDH